ncbi:helix-turn-helix domain-containing protein [Halomonas sp. 328]|uniref:helix-turn-helix domain-containing protein n=1 Tax=Halomonas sp. 328 TaxID=2776704 RepID=UPI0018A7BD0B|nr:helix-turn-helix transcriptional regulator [Halomonas sp. 328]MBF8223546.1 helix-turn-helix transcriptional regulator [Halomonas sp. 328]
MKRKSMTLEERERFFAELEAELASGELTLGQALKRLRRDLLGMTQPAYAKACGLSPTTLRLIEQDKANPTLDTLQQLFGKFGLHLTLVRRPRC